MDINLQLRLGLVNQFIDRYIRATVKKSFDNSLKNNTLDQVTEYLKGNLAVQSKIMAITINTAYPNVFYSMYDIADYVGAYVKKNLESNINEYFKDLKNNPNLPYDWIRNKKTGEYIWDENVTSDTDSDLPKGYTYVGKGNKAIQADFDKNAGWWDKVQQFAGSGGPHVNIPSYIAGKLSPKIENAFLRQKEANRRTIHDPNYPYPNHTFSPIDFGLKGITRKEGILDSNEYDFRGTMDLGGKIIPYVAHFIVRNVGKHLANSIEYRDTFVTGGGHKLYKNAFVFKGSTNMIIVVSIGGEEAVKYVDDFMWNF